jgi:hypothetical protein
MRFGQARWGNLVWGTTLALLMASLGCSRQPGGQASDRNPSDGQQLPFEQASQKNGISPTAALISAGVPAGTAITIRMQSAVSSATARPGDSFEAVLDEPIVIQGQTLAPRGAHLKGKVVDAKASGRLRGPGYLRLTLIAISIGGRSLPLETSSLFVKGASHEKRDMVLIGGGTGAGALIGGLAGGGKGALIGSAIGAAGGTGTAYATGKKDVEFPLERRLTFRLTQTLPVQT